MEGFDGRFLDGPHHAFGLAVGLGMVGFRQPILDAILLGDTTEDVLMLLSEGQMSDFKGAALMLDALPRAKVLLGDRGYDADWFRKALTERDITACIPSKRNRKVPIPHDAVLYRQRHRIENMFGRLKDWRRIHTRAHLPVRHLHRRNCYLLAQSMSPDLRSRESRTHKPNRGLRRPADEHGERSRAW